MLLNLINSNEVFRKNVFMVTFKATQNQDITFFLKTFLENPEGL